MSQSCVMSLVSSNLMRSSLFSSFKSKPWSILLIAAASSVPLISKSVRGLLLTTRFNFINRTGPSEIQFLGESTSEVLELPNILEIKSLEVTPEATTIPSDPPPLGPPQNPGPEFPVPPSPSPPMPDTPNPPVPEMPPDVVPPNWEPPRPPEIFPPESPPPPGIDTPLPGIDPPPLWAHHQM